MAIFSDMPDDPVAGAYLAICRTALEMRVEFKGPWNLINK